MMLGGVTRPARAANLARNLLAEPTRAERWRSARDALWAVLERHVPAGASVAVVGAGRADDLPLTRLLARAGAVDLIDLWRTPCRQALRREPSAVRARGRALTADVTGGAADRIVRAAQRGRRPRHTTVPTKPLGTYDVVVGDLFYTQLLYPGLLDSGLARKSVSDALAEYGQPLCDAVVARLHASAPAGIVVHVHDVLGWWPGHRPTAAINELLSLASDPALFAARVRAEQGPAGCDVEAALAHGEQRVLERAAWRWPFADGVDYLVQATAAQTA